MPTRKANGNGAGFHVLRAFLIGLREWWREAPQSIRRALVGFALIVLFSVGVFHFALGLRMVDAFYFVITTVTTVGYGDLSLVNASPLLKLYGTFLMLCGAALLATLFSIITDLVLKTRFRDVLARGCSRYKDHVIVAGLENLGFRMAKELVQSGETVVVIDSGQEGEFTKAARETASVITGNARTEETLLKAGIAGARAIVAAGADDLENLSIGLAAKKANPGCRVVLRVFDSALAGKMQQRLGFDSVMSVSACAAPDFVGAALYPGASHAILLEDGLLAIRSEIVGATDAQAEGVGLFVRPRRWPLRGRREEAHVSSPAASQRPSTAGRNENAPFVAVGPEAEFEPGDEVIRARWFPLTPSDP
jgi:Trk K+ transport system NAD-binding subunit